MNRRHAKKMVRIKQFLLVIGIILLILFGKLVFNAAKYIPVLYGLVFQKTISVKTTADNKVNILLLGTGGGSHDGPNLTDTIIFASIDPASKSATLISLPRDLWVPEVHGKINSAYANAEDEKKGSGLTLAKATVGHILNQHIDYGFRIDFSGFVKAIDLLGGVDVTVDNTLDDYAYPVEGKEDDTCGLSEDEIASRSAQIASSSATEGAQFPCRYEHLHIPKGLQHMDGTTALKFVRSRHALGAEGSDFARSKRQQKVIEAVKAKVFSAGTFLNPIKLTQLYDTFKDSIDTDISQEEYDDFIKLAQKMKSGKITSAVIDTEPQPNGESLLYNPTERGEDLTPYYGAWVLIPTDGNGNYSGIQSYVACLTNSKLCPKPTPMPTLPGHKVPVK
jgi:LCP family protein required for cell wall assembly